jgi:DNA polymerase (family 10)
MAGDFHRGSELVSDLALVAEKDLPDTSQLKFGELTVHIAGQDLLGAAMLYATGSQAHLTQLETLAKRKGLRFDANGLRRNGKLIAGSTEDEIYHALGLSFIDPNFGRAAGKSLLLDEIGCLPSFEWRTFAASSMRIPTRQMA